MTRYQTRLALWMLVLALCAASLACWSSDTLFIPPTSTPTATPVPPTPDTSTLYKIGDQVKIIGEGIAPVYLSRSPEPASRRNRVPNAACYPNSIVTIEAVQRADGVAYYQISCTNISGWVAEEKLGLP